MDKIRITGGAPLNGTIPICGAKNAALPLMAASLLTSGTLTLSNVPHLVDIQTMTHLLQQHGVDAEPGAGGDGRTLSLTAARIDNTTAPYDVVRKMRASVLVLGPILARVGEARVSLPGGCAIGARPVNLHIEGLKQLGAEIDIEAGYIVAKVRGRLKGAHIRFPIVSVGASENLVMAAALAEGETILDNVAREPEVADLANCLVAMGAEIEGIGTERMVVQGKERLHGAEYRIMPDRIETGTFAVAAAITGGDIELLDTKRELIASVADSLAEAGVDVAETARGIRVRRTGNRVQGVDVMTQPYPGFPTDMQAQMMTLMTMAEGASMITETIFENRFMHVPELSRMGANITVHGASAMIRGVPRLKGAPVMATDLRASVSLVLAGLAAEGETLVNRVYHLDRGFERLEAKLAACGADIERVGD
ncbi:MAG TPA: UDP-N-acetylglucosamine 1-carboxyvinyltransferase [Candidatus Cybelea sp.]|nr:UDP-N-acetylglucosamine 1-carboxyvinyltransferase [Candidatus Cybelea sp.]